MLVNYGNKINFSTIDYPGKISTVIFLAGCHVRCPRCHNKQFWDMKNYKDIKEIYEIIDNVDKKYVNAIVISGGEPLEQPKQIIEIAKYARSKNFKVGLHTSGEGPLADIIEYFDYILLNTIRE